MKAQVLQDVCNGIHIHNLGDIYYPEFDQEENDFSIEHLQKLLNDFQVGLLIVDNKQKKVRNLLDTISKKRSPNFRARCIAKWSKTSNLWIVYTGKHKNNR